MLAQGVVQAFAGKARFVAENYGDSELAKRFGVTRYPAIFVDDILVAKPKDFGFYGKGEGSGDGRYTPFKSAASQTRFRDDLTRMIDLVLAGRKDAAQAEAARPEAAEIATLPALALAGLDGQEVRTRDLAGRVVLVEFWATWCPPCRGTLSWLGSLKSRHPGKLEVVAVAVESDPDAVRTLAAELRLPLTWAIGTPELARAFGDVNAVPTLLVFGPQGNLAGAYYGAPEGLHARLEAELGTLLN